MDNHRENVKLVQEAVEKKCAGLLPDPFLAQRVLNAAGEHRNPRERKPFSVGLAFALVLMTVITVAVSLNREPEQSPQVVTASLPEGEEPGFTHVNPSRPLLPASGHTCKYHLHRAEQLCYRYYDGKQDVLSVEFVIVCDICGKFNGLAYAPYFKLVPPYDYKDTDALIEAQIEENMRDHEWVVYDKHIEGTDTHEFTRVCTQCRTRWVPVVLPCMGGDEHIAPDMQDIWPED